jgi:hypothetical protein
MIYLEMTTLAEMFLLFLSSVARRLVVRKSRLELKKLAPPVVATRRTGTT